MEQAVVEWLITVLAPHPALTMSIVSVLAPIGVAWALGIAGQAVGKAVITLRKAFRWRK